MLHILWGILKIIFILAAILIGLAAVLIFLVLFCPIRYRLSATCKGKEAFAKAGVSWLFRLIWVSIVCEQRRLSYRIYILGVPLETFQKFAAKFKKRKKKVPKDKPQKQVLEEYSGEEEKNEEYKQSRNLETLTDLEHTEESEREESAAPGWWGNIKKIFIGLARLFRRMFTAGLRVILWICHIPGRIYQGIRKIALTITEFCGNMERWKAFIEDERVRTAFGLVFGKGKRLLRHIFPTKTEGWVLFGFEDPSITGQILAAAGMTCPIHKNTIELRPVFDEKIFEADVKLRGRIRLFVILKEGLELYFDKNVKYMMKAWKKEA